MAEEQRKKKLFKIEVDKLTLLHETLKEELEAEERRPTKQKKQMKSFDETEEDTLRFEKMARKVKQMKALSKQPNTDPLFQSIAGVLSLYQGTLFNYILF